MEKATDQVHVNNFNPSSCKYSKQGNSMENLPTVEKYFVRYHYAPHLAIALIFCLISPAVIGYSNLDTAQAARVMEMYFSITGMLLFAPLLIPEQDRSIRALIKSKELPPLAAPSGQTCHRYTGGSDHSINNFIYNKQFRWNHCIQQIVRRELC